MQPGVACAFNVDPRVIPDKDGSIRRAVELLQATMERLRVRLERPGS